jgi:hypothetical protein
MADLRRYWQCGIGFATLDLAEVFPTDATLTSEAVFAQPTAFPDFLKPTRQPLADALGVVVGVVIARHGWHPGSSPEFVEHELLLDGA